MRLNDVIPWGRSQDEYARMFRLTAADDAKRVLGCGDGPASFNAQATARGGRVVSCDPIYAFSAAEIEQRVHACYESVVSQVRAAADGYVWTHFRDADDLGRARLQAMREFLADYEAGRAVGRYVEAALPTLPFASGEFDLALCSHLLFLYTDQLSLETHVAGALELLRVASEARIFPLVTLRREWSPFVEPVRAALEEAGFVVSIEATDYEFQRADDHAGNRMMRVRRA